MSTVGLVDFFEAQEQERVPSQLAGAREAFRQREHAAQRQRLQELFANINGSIDEE